MRVVTAFVKTTTNERKTLFERRIRIKCTAPWISAPAALLLTNGERRVNVRIDPTQTEEGRVSLGEVLGYDEEETVESGPLFRFPITVIRPEQCGALWSTGLTLETAQLNRTFLTVPNVRAIILLYFTSLR